MLSTTLYNLFSHTRRRSWAAASLHMDYCPISANSLAITSDRKRQDFAAIILLPILPALPMPPEELASNFFNLPPPVQNMPPRMRPPPGYGPPGMMGRPPMPPMGKLIFLNF